MPSYSPRSLGILYNFIFTICLILVIIILTGQQLKSYMHKNKKTAVIKVGSSVLAPEGELDVSILSNIAKQSAQAKKNGWNICIVSSGAIAAGIKQLGLKKYPKSINKLQAAASIGQILLMEKYIKAFSSYKIKISQVLLTWEDFHCRSRYINAKRTIQTLWQYGIIPIVNENDTISTEEIKFGDNDRLSALTAGLVGANKLILLSDVSGVYDDNAQVIKELDFKNIYYGKTFLGKASYTKGGIRTKLESAKIAAFAGIEVFIASGRDRNTISLAIAGNNPGTRFVANTKIPAKKLWIAFARKIKGELTIDKGAEQALVNRNSSLLSVGVKAVKGDFNAKDTVYIKNEENKIIAAGIVNFPVFILKENLGKKLPKEVIHRDDLVIF